MACGVKMCTVCKRNFISSLRKFRNDITWILHRRKSTSTVTQAQYCMDIVRKYDYENFLTCLLFPKAARASAFTIRAFNVEVAQIEDVVSEAQIGLMRIQFWRDTLDKIFKDSPPETPIALELAKANRKHRLTKRWFSQMLDAREAGLRREPYSNMTQVEEYSDRAFSSAIYLLLESLGIRDVQADHAASHVGKATGITTLIRSVPFHARRQNVHLPMPIMMQHDVSQEDFVRGSKEQKVKDVIYSIASSANNHLKLARDMRKSVPKGTHQALLSTVMCDSYLKSLQQADFDVFDPRLSRRNNWLPLLLWLQKSKRTF